MPIPIAKFLKDLLISLFATESIAFLIDVVIPFTAFVNDSRPLLIDLNISKDLPALIPINIFTKSLMSSTTLSAPKNSRILSLNGIRFLTMMDKPFPILPITDPIPFPIEAKSPFFRISS